MPITVGLQLTKPVLLSVKPAGLGVLRNDSALVDTRKRLTSPSKAVDGIVKLLFSFCLR
jgi:hypothetical protein